MNKFDNATPQEIVEALAEGMIRRGDGCTAALLKLDGFNDDHLRLYGDRARERAMALTERYTRRAMPARRAA
ncbi:hypothetical protein [Rhizobium sp. PL01]|uniref:hypothetical protein n=1 Tax=Rhizobium sp. PL01 TaxID=3085631 RepID=UPI00298227D8|nr:hypothetical protein [Rhizobium sp. PL01]MDW5314994.1 hypothetical protein [Rhizobium sp. PL01]